MEIRPKSPDVSLETRPDIKVARNNSIERHLTELPAIPQENPPSTPAASVVLHPHPTTPTVPKIDDSVEIQPKSYDDNLENQDDVNLELNTYPLILQRLSSTT